MDPITKLQEDVLSEVLQSVHLHSTLYCRARLSAPWGLAVPHRDAAVFHIVTQGTCWLRIEGMAVPIRLAAGELVILPHGDAHSVTDDLDSPVTRLEDFAVRYHAEPNAGGYGEGQGAAAMLVCGGLELEEYPANPLYSLLPIYLRAPIHPGNTSAWIDEIVKLVAAEAGASEPGAEAVIQRLSEVLFIRTVRTYLRASADERRGWLAALKDPEIGRALAVIRHQPEQAWTIAALAREVGLSRSAFAAKFAELVGEPPVQYLTRIRMTKGAMLLRTQSAPLSAVARAVGYDSDVTFSKAFKRWLGMAPGAYRRERRASGAASPVKAAMVSVGAGEAMVNAGVVGSVASTRRGAIAPPRRAP
jgi:AraC family transcriptional regulator, alkane utilization regulator